ncbi:MAG TPA: response regulator [Tepidisphaeraceae bacterium]|nr:response regulator [Tepidisphaeraceae bacterium]
MVATDVLEILMVEDNPADIRLAREAFQEGRHLKNLHVVQDGTDAIDFLRRRGKFANAVKPDLIFLDLNLPRMDGRQVLAEIKSDPNLRRIPVVVLTTSSAERDILRSYDLHANCYIVKPVDLDDFISTILKLEDFWLTSVTLPPQ